VSIHCDPLPNGHQGFGFSTPGSSNDRIQHFMSGRRSGVFTLLVFCILTAGCGTSTQPASTSSTPVTMLQASPSSVSFGNVTVGQTATSKVSLYNPGSQSVSVAQISVTGQSFFLDGNVNLPVSIAPGTTYTFAIGFTPTTASAYSGQFMATDSSAQSVAQGSISGSGDSGSSSGSPQLSLSTASLVFNSVTDGSSSTLPVTLTSSGTAAVTISSATISGTGFSFSGATFPLTLNPTQSVTLQVQFAPTDPGGDTGTLVVNSNSATNPTATVSLSGTGTASTTPTPTLTVSTSSLIFGTVEDDSTAMLPVTLSSSGTAAVTVNSATISGSTDFTFTGATFPLTLNPTQSVTLQVTFAPTEGLAETGSLTISSNSSTNPTATVSLSGTGAHWVALGWTAPSSSPVPITGYNVYRATGGSSTYTLLNTSVIGGTSYSDTNVQNGIQYSYYVESVAASGAQSTPSQSVSVTIP